MAVMACDTADCVMPSLDAARVKLNEMHFFPIDNRDTEERVFFDDQLHVTYTVPFAKIPRYRAKEPRDPFFKQAPELTTEYYRCNTKREPLDNPKVRQALVNIPPAGGQITVRAQYLKGLGGFGPLD